MAYTRFWAPLFLLTLASSLKCKWSSRSLDASRCNCTKHLALLREFSRSKSWNICYSLHQRGLPQLTMLLLLGGDVELNPGDKWKFPCGICTKPVKINQKGIQCDECNSWFHSKCCDISPTMYDILAFSSCTWICPQCGLPNLSDSFFDSSMNTVNSPSYFKPLDDMLSLQERMEIHSQSSKTRPKPKRVLKSAKRKSLTCLVVNCRSVKNKIADVEAIIDEYKPDIILGNESWLNSDILSSEIFPANYTVYRKDRNSKCHGGGVFQAIKNDLIVLYRPEFDANCEIIWTQCQLAGSNTKSIFFGSFIVPKQPIQNAWKPSGHHY